MHTLALSTSREGQNCTKSLKPHSHAVMQPGIRCSVLSYWCIVMQSGVRYSVLLYRCTIVPSGVRSSVLVVELHAQPYIESQSSLLLH